MLECLKSALHGHLRISDFILFSVLTFTALGTLDILLFLPLRCRANEALIFTELVCRMLNSSHLLAGEYLIISNLPFINFGILGSVFPSVLLKIDQWTFKMYVEK